MSTFESLRDLGFSQYEISCYLALIANHPANGSQLSKFSGVSRSRIYDVLRNMTKKGLVLELENGLYVPLPPDELMRRVRDKFESNFSTLKSQLEDAFREPTYEYIWIIRGHEAVIKKAKEMIASSREELYVRLFPKEAEILEKDLHEASTRGVSVRYIAMGKTPLTFNIQVVHPDPDKLVETIGGRSFDIISDKSESLVGIFEDGNEDQSAFNWTRNRWFIVANRDSVRHDFYHYYLHKTYDLKQPLTEREKWIYEFIKADD
jgi:sugar-specific transcriptional regulator TrmB